jgi:hypothetical protein
MLKKYYTRVASKDDSGKKDADDGSKDAYPTVENVFLIFGGGAHGRYDVPTAQA